MILGWILLAAGTALAAPTLKDCPTCPELVIVPAGKFVMGSGGGVNDLGATDEVDHASGEATPLAITIARPFALGRFEVTRAEYARFIKESGHPVTKGCRGWVDGWDDRPQATWRTPPQPAKPGDRHPVVCVSWHDAQAYAAWLAKSTGKSYRLPSESEWEYAARAGSTTPRPFGNNSFEGVSISLACENANVFDVTSQATYLFAAPYARCKDGHADLAPVGVFKANAFGLHDMIGNVLEWVGDCYTASYWGRPPDARTWVWKGGCETRPLRGGSWASRPADARSARRLHADPDTRQTTIGFRVARDLAPDELKPEER